MALTTTELFGFADAVIEAMTVNEAELLAKGVTVGPWLTEGAALKSAAVTRNNAQEAAKAALKTATTQTDDALQAAYDFFSSKLDAIAGAYGKTSDMGKQLLRLRSNVRRGPNHPTPPAPGP